MEDTRPPKCAMFGELVGGADCVMGCLVDYISELSVSTPISGRLPPRTRGNGLRRRNKVRNVPWRNGSMQKKSGLDYGMHEYTQM